MKEQTIYSVKAGRFNFDKTEKKVRVSKDKGLLSIFTVIYNACRMKKIKIILVGLIKTLILKKLISLFFLLMQFS